MREVLLKSGRCDYLLLVDRNGLGVIEAKKTGMTLSTVAEQSGQYGENRHERKEAERFKSFSYDDLLKRDKVNLDILWLKDDSLEESVNLPGPDVIAAEIAEDLEVALEQFATIAEDMKKPGR